MPVLQVGLLVFFLLVAVLHFMYSWWLLIPCFCAGEPHGLLTFICSSLWHRRQPCLLIIATRPESNVADQQCVPGVMYWRLPRKDGACAEETNARLMLLCRAAGRRRLCKCIHAAGQGGGALTEGILAGCSIPGRQRGNRPG